MMSPYKIEGPALISFSGGRTSGFMLWNIVKAHGGRLPDNVHVVFANTGKEAPETLDFVNEISEKWDIHIHWLEHYFGDERPIHRTKEVTYETAARNPEGLLVPKRLTIMKFGQTQRLCMMQSIL